MACCDCAWMRGSRHELRIGTGDRGTGCLMNRNNAFNKLHEKSTLAGVFKGMEQAHCIEFGLFRAIRDFRRDHRQK